jgi:2,4-dienoyl-CoA reductase-like NADH-dependent reductase (Old Yellow Enzyme family)
MTESATVAPEGLTTPQDTDMWNDEQQAVWTRIVEFGHSQGAAMAIHSWPTADAMPGVSRLPRRARRLRWDRRLSPTPGAPPVPHALTIEEIGGGVQAFVDAAGALIVPVRRR